MTKTAQEIFGKPTPKPASAGALFKHFKRKEGPRKLNIKTRPCPDCGETTTSATRYFCAGCHFAGWWGRWA